MDDLWPPDTSLIHPLRGIRCGDKRHKVSPQPTIPACPEIYSVSSGLFPDFIYFLCDDGTRRCIGHPAVSTFIRRVFMPPLLNVRFPDF